MYTFSRVRRNGTARSAKSNRSELFIAAFGRKISGGGDGGHGGTLDRKIPYLRHTPRALRDAPRILASLPWARYRPAIRRRLVSDVRAKTKPAMNLGILFPSPRADRLPRDNEARSRCSRRFISRKRCLAAAGGAKNSVRANWTRLSVSKRRHAGDDRKTTRV